MKNKVKPTLAISWKADDGNMLSSEGKKGNTVGCCV
jgi:hypothetical protein